MYGFSRAIYRALADEIIETSPGYENHGRVLRSCEAAVERLATDRRYFARPSQTLFREIRIYFPMKAQLKVLRVIEHFLALADGFFKQLPQTGFDVNGEPLQCHATTRKGTPCQRMPLPRNGYCPSHQHLVETDGLPVRVAA